MKGKSYSKTLALLAVFICLIAGAIWLAAEAAANPLWQARVAEAGYLGVFAAGVVGGLNFIVPIPPATLTPLFVAGGLTLPFIVISLALGTLVADFTGYLFGRISRDATKDRYPNTFAFFTRLGTSYRWHLIPVVALYAAFVPFPNEAILIPLALSGVRFSILFPALLVGNVVHQATIVFAVASVTT